MANDKTIADIIGHASGFSKAIPALIDTLKGTLDEDQQKEFDKQIKKSEIIDAQKELDKALKTFGKLKTV